MLLWSNVSLYSKQSIQIEHLMKSNSAVQTAVSLFLFLATTLSPLQAEPPVRHRAVDVFSLHDGTRLLGVSFTPAHNDSQSVLLNAKWLRQEYPLLFQQFTTQETEPHVGEADLAHLVRQHIEKLRSTKPAQFERIGYLQERLIDIEANAKQPTMPDLILVEVSESVIRRQLLQEPEIRRVGQLAMLNRIPDIETISATEANAALVARSTESPLRVSLPNSAAESPDRELLRLLIATERLFGQTSRLINVNGRYVSADNQSAAIQQLLPDMLQGQIQKQLSDLLGHPTQKTQGSALPLDQGTPLDSVATQMAGQSSLVEVSRLGVDPASGTARVTIEMYFRAVEGDEFRLHASESGRASTKDTNHEQMQRINDDPRVKQITQLFGSLGAGSEELNTALSMGAVVGVAQANAKRALEEQLSNTTGVAGVGTPIVLRVELNELSASK